jgi:SulP family sulfate permease
MTITRLSELQSDDVRAVTDPRQTDLELSALEKELLIAAAGKVLLLHLKGTMIFGTSRAISRKISQIEDCMALVVDLKDVPHLGVSSALVLEEALLDMIDAGRSVYVVGASDQHPINRLETMGVLKKIPAENITDKRAKALKLAVG